MRFTALEYLKAPLILALAGFSACGSEPEWSDTRPDLFVIVVDTLRADRLGCYGYERPTSPFINRLAAEGVLFADNTAQCAWTKPSVVSIFNGRYITSYRDIPIEGVPTIPETFHDAGYGTIGVVGNVLLSKKSGFGAGFDHYDARERTREQIAASKSVGKQGGPCRALDTMRMELVEQLAPEVARRANGERQPQFVYLHPMDPHAPYDQRPEYEEFLPVEGAVPALPTPWHEELVTELDRQPGIGPFPKDWRRINRHRGQYDKAVRFTDEQLEALFEDLERDGLLDNAIVAIVADHGEALFDHPDLMPRSEMRVKPVGKLLQMEHGRNLYRSLVGTPFILWGTGVPKGRVVESAVENIDLYPTLMNLANLPAPPGLHGSSLVPAMHGEEVAKPFVHSFVMYGSSIRDTTSGLELILPSEIGENAGGAPLLFDLSADPDQHDNMYGERPDETVQLSARLDQWREQFPVESTILNSRDEDTIRNMRALGYTGTDE